MFRRLLVFVLLVLMLFVGALPAQAQDAPVVLDKSFFMPIVIRGGEPGGVVVTYSVEVREATPDQNCTPGCLSVELLDKCYWGALPVQYSSQHYSAKITTNYVRERFIPYHSIYSPPARMYTFFEQGNPLGYTCAKWKANDGPWAGQWAGNWCGTLGQGQILVLAMSRMDMTC